MKASSRTKSKQDLLDLIANTADGVFAVDSMDRIILWNRSAETLLGFRSDDVLGRPCYEVIQGTDHAGNLFCFKGCSVRTMARQDTPIHNYDVQVITKEGRRVWLNTSIVLIPAPPLKDQIIVHLFRPMQGAGLSEALANRIASEVIHLLRISPEGPSVQKTPSAAATSLSRREIEVLTLLAHCFGTQEIADRLCISAATVRTHVQNILGKLQVHSRLQAVALAFQQNLLKQNAPSHPTLPL